MSNSPSNPTPISACIGVGANLGDPVAAVQSGIQALGEMPETRLGAISSLYRSPPMGPANQPDYINAVAAIETTLEPLALLSALQDVENRHGRARDGGVRWGPRALDLDILLYGDRQITEERLTVPHPGLPERAFVLYPLYEIDPWREIPGQGPVWLLLMDLRKGPV